MNNSKKTAWVKAMDYLARRDHSEKELIEKLSRFFEWKEIEPVLQEMKERGWILPPRELAKKVTESLHRKNKGHLYIQNFLRKKGLPGTPKEAGRELEKAHLLIETKRRGEEDPQRMVSLLKNRGFDTETISRVIHEIRRNPPSIY